MTRPARCHPDALSTFHRRPALATCVLLVACATSQAADTDSPRQLGTVVVDDAKAGAASLQEAGQMPATVNVSTFVTNQFVK